LTNFTEIHYLVDLEELVTSFPGKTLALFTAPTWCVPCQRFEPHWLKAQESDALNEYQFVSVDMGMTPEDTGRHWATDTFSILGVPTLLVFNGSIGDWEPVKARAIVPLIRELTA
jgi:thiol:disulfide interchange protein